MIMEAENVEIYEVLQRDHRRVREMFEELVATQDLHLMQLLQAQLRDDLEAHTRLEEELFYPYLREAEVTRDLVRDSYRDHDELNALLQTWNDQEVHGREWHRLVERLRKLVGQHIQDEETRLFPRARQVLSGERAAEMGERALEMKRIELEYHRSS